MIRKYIAEFTTLISKTYQTEEKGSPFDKETALICTLSALTLLFIQFIAKTGNFIYFLKELGLYNAVDFFRIFFAPTQNGNLTQLLWFASFCLFFYMIFPMLFMSVFFGKTFKDYGLKLKGSFLHGKFYIIFMIIMLPLIITAATFPSFQNTYPFFRVPEGLSIWPNILIWEIFYFLQFLGTEFFFRGFLIHGLKARFGFYAIFVSTIPYCMIHFQKPFLEAFGSIFAGIILGMMSLRTNSIIMGVMLHFGVAVTMDICSLLMR